MSDELRWSDDDIRQLRDAVNHLLEINEELNSKIIAMDAFVKNGESKIKLLQRYVQSLELTILNLQNEATNNHNCPN